MKKMLYRFWPVLFVIFLWFLFASPYFLRHQVPYPSRYQVSFFPPWSAYQEYWGPVKNNAMPDVIDQIYPWKYFTIDNVKSGTIPYWNPYNFAGNPHVANFQSAVFSPFNLFYFLLPFVDAWSVVVLLQPLLAGVFTYMFLRELKVLKAGAVLGGITYMFCGFMVVWMAYGTLSMAAAFLPLALWGIERGFSRSRWYFAVMMLSLVISFFSGHFQTSFYVVLYVFGYLLFRSVILGNFRFFSKASAKLKHSKTFLSARTTTLWAFGFYLLAFIISLPQLYPTVQFYQESVRSGLVYQGGGIPLDYLITALAPDFYGNPVTRNDWRGNYAEWASFVGVIPFIFALFAVWYVILNSFQDLSKRSLEMLKQVHRSPEVGVQHDKHITFFVIAGIACLLFSMETPLRGLMTASNIPIIATSIPSRLIVLFSFSVAVLAGLGWSYFWFWNKKSLTKTFFPVVVFVFMLFVIAGVSVTVLKVFPEEKNSLALKNLVLPGVLFFIASFLLFVSKFFSKKHVVVVISFLILILAGFDSYRFAMKWMPFDPKTHVFPDVPVLAAMKEKIGYGRVYGNLGTEVNTYYGLPSLEGYDPLYIQRYGEFIMYSRQGSFLPAERSVVRLDRRGKYTDRVLDVLGVNLIFHPLADTGQSWAFPVWEDIKKYSVIYQDDKFQLYKNNAAMSRVVLFRDYEVIPDGRKLLQRFYSPDFDFRNTLLLEEDPAMKINASSTGSARIVSYTPNMIKIVVRSSHPALLFLSDTYYPGWKVTVNGEHEKLYRANYAFRAVKVPGGESTVVFSF